MNEINKHKILSEVEKVFDPLGFLGPITVRGKVLLQKFWKIKKTWDEEVPPEIKEDFLKYINNLSKLSDFTVPRNYVNFFDAYSIKLFGFCDAYKEVCAAVIYALDPRNKDSLSTLVGTKTKIAPIKELEIPRLELVAAELLAKFVNRIARTFKIPDSSIKLYSDSKVVLSWIARPSKPWKKFVKNRVNVIVNKLPLPIEKWNYINTKQNPAGIPTRNIDVSRFLASSLMWLHGPRQFICEDISEEYLR